MCRRQRWFPLSLGLVALIGVGWHVSQADEAKRLTAEDLLTRWEPMRDGVEDFQRFWASPRGSTREATATFRVVGPYFVHLWNHYADLCGMTERYEARQLRRSGGTSARGVYIVNDRWSSPSTGERGISVFLLRTDRYAVTATIQPDPDGKAVRGSIAAFIL